MRFIFLVYALQVLCAVHAIKRGASYPVLMLILAFPVLGVLVYIIAVLLPEWRKSRAARNAAEKVKDTIDPDRYLRASEKNLEITDSIENRIKYADELALKGNHGGAAEHYDNCLTGSFESDPAILLKSAKAHFDSGNSLMTVNRLDFLRKENPEYQSESAHLLYARALEASGSYQEAYEEYEAVCRYFNGPEAKCWFGLMLRNFDHRLEAADKFKEVLESAKNVPANLTSINQKWLTMAERQLEELYGGN